MGKNTSIITHNCMLKRYIADYKCGMIYYITGTSILNDHTNGIRAKTKFAPKRPAKPKNEDIDKNKMTVKI